jgi:hypothetical protein
MYIYVCVYIRVYMCVCIYTFFIVFTEDIKNFFTVSQMLQ